MNIAISEVSTARGSRPLLTLELALSGASRFMLSGMVVFNIVCPPDTAGGF